LINVNYQLLGCSSLISSFFRISSRRINQTTGLIAIAIVISVVVVIHA